MVPQKRYSGKFQKIIFRPIFCPQNVKKGHFLPFFRFFDIFEVKIWAKFLKSQIFPNNVFIGQYEDAVYQIGTYFEQNCGTH